VQRVGRRAAHRGDAQALDRGEALRAVLAAAGDGEGPERASLEAEARALGIFDWLRKPVDIEVLVARIRAAYQESRKGAALAAVTFAEAGEHETAKELLDR
jgi:CheY-like chemotaxis protein